MTPNVVVADDTALLALGAGSQAMSRLVTAALGSPGQYLIAPAMCIASAIARRPQLGEHIGGLDAIHIIDLGFANAQVAGEAVAAGVAWGQAHAVAAALPSAEWPAGLPVITTTPGSYRRHGIQVIALP